MNIVKSVVELSTASAILRGPGYYVVIRGPLGVGKSTVSARLSKRIGAAVISIDRILDDHGLWNSGRVSEFLHANRIAAPKAVESLSRGDPVIFDGNFYWKSQIEDLIDRLDYPHLIFTLEAPLSVCIERDRRRRPSHGRRAAEAVFAKSTKFDWGIRLDATQPIQVLIRRMISKLAPAHPSNEAVR